MENVVLIIHLILALAIIGLVLIQRSEGGGLGIGGGSGGLGGLATPGGTASALTRMTAFFAACFFATSLTLAIMAGAHHNESGILDANPNAPTISTSAPAVPVGDEGIVSDENSVNDNISEVAPDESAPAVSVSEESTPDATEPAQKPSVPVGE